MSLTFKVATLSDIPLGTSKKIEVEGKEIAFFNVDGSFFAIDNICPHRGGPLSEGHVENGVVTCPWHGWQFQLDSGECMTAPGVCQNKYPVQIKGDDIFICL